MTQDVRVILVGHCIPDSMFLTRFVRKHAKGATVERVNKDAALTEVLGQPMVLLINRVLDGRFADLSGQRVLEQTLNTPSVPLLISNHADAQQAASEAGALRGFGKAELGNPESAQRLLAAMELLAVR